MAEAAGLIASVITIIQVATNSVEYVKSVYRATEEFEALREQLQHFASLVKEINNQHPSFSSTVITTSLSRAKLTIQRLDQLIKLKILKDVNGKSRARRRAWTRN